MSGWEDVTRKVYKGQGVASERLKVFGGWVFRTFSWTDDEEDSTESCCFVPDPEHKWELD